MSRLTQKFYGDGNGAGWYETQMGKSPEYALKLFELFKQEGIIPEDEELEGFTLVDVSANRAELEVHLAVLLDRQIKGQEFVHSPKVIAIDFLGKKEGEKEDGSYDRFVSGIQPEKIPNLKNVEFSRISADARQLPLAEGSVDVLFDRLGALWYSVHDKGGGLRRDKTFLELQKIVLEILKNYARTLKEKGKIIVDATQKGMYLNQVKSEKSTAVALSEVGLSTPRGLQDLEDIGLRVKFVGKGADRLLVFEKVDKNK